MKQESGRQVVLRKERATICITVYQCHYFPGPLPLSSNLFKDLNLTYIFKHIYLEMNFLIITIHGKPRHLLQVKMIEEVE